MEDPRDKRKFWEKNEKSKPVKATGRTAEQIKTDKTIKQQRRTPDRGKNRKRSSAPKHFQEETSDVNHKQHQKEERINFPDVFSKSMKSFLTQERFPDKDKHHLMRLAREVDKMNFFNKENKAEIDHLTEMQHAVKMVFTRGFYLRDVYQDGNCLYSSLALTLGLNANLHATVRRSIFGYIRKHPNLFRAFMPQGVEEYCQEHEPNTQWGGEIEIFAASYMLKRQINVHRLKYSILEYTPIEKSGSASLNLIYLFGSHYAALITRQKENRPAKTDAATFSADPRFISRSESESEKTEKSESEAEIQSASDHDDKQKQQPTNMTVEEIVSDAEDIRKHLTWADMDDSDNDNPTEEDEPPKAVPPPLPKAAQPKAPPKRPIPRPPKPPPPPPPPPPI